MKSPSSLRDYVDEINSPSFGVWLDLGNVRKLGRTENWVRMLDTRIVKLM